MIALEPIAVDRETAAASLSISEGSFHALVASGVMPQPRQFGKRRAAWLVSELREAAARLPISTMLPPPGKAA